MITGVACHLRWEPGDYQDWDHPNPTQRLIMQRHSFARGEWGGDWHPDFAPKPGDLIAGEHWGQSGFANTDLDFLLKQKGITHVIVVGLLANTCIESTARYAMELGYHVTLVRDATAATSDAMRPFHINIPEADLVDLRRRLAATRWPEKETVTDDSQGVPLAMQQDLVRYWQTDYDWRKVEARFNALPQVITEI